MAYGRIKVSNIEVAAGDDLDLTAVETKLDGIESGATADQTGAEIKTAYEAEADTNAYDDAAVTKLAGIEESATADQTGAEIKAAYEGEADTNAYDDAAVTKLAGIEESATADQTGAEIKAAYEGEANTNAYDDAAVTKLAGIAAGAEVNTVDSVAGKTGAVSLAKADVGLSNVDNTSDADKPVSSATQTALNAKADDSAMTTALAAKADLVGGKLSTSQIPDLAVTEFLGVAASQSAMLALSGQKGDWCNRSDTGQMFIIIGDDPTDANDWAAVSYPASPVVSVAGKTGAVTLSQDDIGSGAVSASTVTATGDARIGANLSNASSAKAEINAYGTFTSYKGGASSDVCFAAYSIASAQNTVEIKADGSITADGDVLVGDATASVGDAKAATIIQNGAVNVMNTDGSGSQTLFTGYGAGAEKFTVKSDGSITTDGNINLDGHLDMGDSRYILLGNHDDLKLYHNGSDSYIQDEGTGALKLTTDGAGIDLQKGTSEYLARFYTDGPVELFHNNSKKLATKSDGVDITGELQCDSLEVGGDIAMGDNDKILLGSSDDLKIYHNGSNYIDSNSDFYLRVNNGTETALFATANGPTYLYWNNNKKLETKSDGVTITGQLQCDSMDVDGDIVMGDSDKLRLGASNDLQIYHNGVASYISDEGTGTLKLTSNGTGIELQKGTSEYLARFHTDGAVELYHNNSKKLETKSDGVDITGKATADTLRVNSTSEFTGDATFYNGAGAVTIASNSDIRLTNGNWTGEAAYKIQAHSNWLYFQSNDGWIFRNSGGTNRVSIDQYGKLTAVTFDVDNLPSLP